MYRTKGQAWRSRKQASLRTPVSLRVNCQCWSKHSPVLCFFWAQPLRLRFKVLREWNSVWPKMCPTRCPQLIKKRGGGGVERNLPGPLHFCVGEENSLRIPSHQHSPQKLAESPRKMRIPTGTGKPRVHWITDLFSPLNETTSCLPVIFRRDTHRTSLPTYQGPVRTCFGHDIWGDTLEQNVTWFHLRSHQTNRVQSCFKLPVSIPTPPSAVSPGSSHPCHSPCDLCPHSLPCRAFCMNKPYLMTKRVGDPQSNKYKKYWSSHTYDSPKFVWGALGHPTLKIFEDPEREPLNHTHLGDGFQVAFGHKWLNCIFDRWRWKCGKFY